MAEQSGTAELHHPSVVVGIDWGELAMNGYMISLRRDEADLRRKFVYLTIAKGDESATFHGEFMKVSFYAYAWASRQ